MKNLIALSFMILFSLNYLFAQSDQLLSFFKVIDSLNTKKYNLKEWEKLTEIPSDLIVNELCSGDSSKIFTKLFLVNDDTQEERIIIKKNIYKAIGAVKSNDLTLLIIWSNSDKGMISFSFYKRKLIDTLCLYKRIGDTETSLYKVSKLFKENSSVYDYGLIGNKPGYIERKKYTITKGKFYLIDKLRVKTNIWPSNFLTGTRGALEIDPFYK